MTVIHFYCLCADPCGLFGGQKSGEHLCDGCGFVCSFDTFSWHKSDTLPSLKMKKKAGCPAQTTKKGKTLGNSVFPRVLVTQRGARLASLAGSTAPKRQSRQGAIDRTQGFSSPHGKRNDRPKAVVSFGDPAGIRTPDTLLKRELCPVLRTLRGLNPLEQLKFPNTVYLLFSVWVHLPCSLA